MKKEEKSEEEIVKEEEVPKIDPEQERLEKELQDKEEFLKSMQQEYSTLKLE